MHPVRHVVGSLSLTRLGGFAVTRWWGTVSSAWFQLPVHNAAPPSLHGVRKGRSPASSLLWSTATPCRPSRRASFPSLGDTTVSSVVRPRRPRTWAADQPGVGKPGLRPALRWRRQGLPSSRETRMIIRHVPPTPVWPGTLVGPSVANAWRGPRDWPRRRLTTRKFRGSITQRLIALSTLRSDGHPPPRKTRFRLLARLCRTGLVTRRVSMKGFTFWDDSPFPSFLAQGQT